MKQWRVVLTMAAAMMLGACTGHESITAPHGDAVLSDEAAPVAATAKKTSRRRSAGRGTGEAFQFEGVIRSASATSIVVFTSKSEEVTIALAPETVIRKGNRTLTVADLIVDARVHVKALQATGGGYAALEVKLQEAEGGEKGEKVELTGTVASVAATSFVVTTATGDVTVQVAASTQIRRGNKKVSLSEVTVGSTVEVEGRRVDATTVEAKKVTVEG